MRRSFFNATPKYEQLGDVTEVAPQLAGRSEAGVDFSLSALGIKRIEKIAAGPDDDRDGGVDVIDRSKAVTKVKPKTQKPSMYRVLLHNDDYTPREYVVDSLKRFFSQSGARAQSIMDTAHRKGICVVGIWTHEVAETKITRAMDDAKQEGHPLQYTMEKDI